MLKSTITNTFARTSNGQSQIPVLGEHISRSSTSCRKTNFYVTTTQFSAVVGLIVSTICEKVRDGDGKFRYFTLDGREFVIDSIKVTNGNMTKYLFDDSQVAELDASMKAEKTSYLSCRIVCKALKFSLITIRQKIAVNDGKLPISLLDGRIFVLDTYARPEGREDIFFRTVQIDEILSEIKKQNASIVTIPQMVKRLRKRGIETTPHVIYGVFRSEGNLLTVRVSGKPHQLELKTATGGKKSSGHQRYLTTKEFKLFAKWMERRARLSMAPKGCIFATEACEKLGLKEGTLKRRILAGELSAKKRGGQYYITSDQFEELKKEFIAKTPPQGAVALLGEISKYGYSTNWLSQRIVRTKKGFFFKFTDENGKIKKIQVYQDKHKKYWVAGADFAEFKKSEAMFGPKGTHCDFKFVAAAIDLSLITLQQLTHDGMLPLHLQGTPNFGLRIVKRGVKCFVKKSDVFAYLRKRDNLDFSRFIIDEDRKRIILSENYGVAVPICPENEMPAEHIGLLSFYSRLFFSSESAAVELIIKFLKNHGKIREEAGLAKLWVAKDYCVTKSLSAKNYSRISRPFGKKAVVDLFRTHPSKGSKIFVKGSPFLDDNEIDDLKKSLAEDHGKRTGDALYPATF
ncbi:MAG: helix-turn-helix domain-containing protein [Candidatus Micrarchaeota archaeon]|nr:helix-turn-helix domain-containing protein [Candidatus Micrarchaeota archaeon]